MPRPSRIALGLGLAWACSAPLGCAGGIDDTADTFSRGPNLPPDEDEDREGTLGGDFDDGDDKAGETEGAEDGGDEGAGSGGVPMGDCNPGEILPCYSGPAGTQDIGACASGQAQCDGGIWTACMGETLPAAEVCDGIDNDCNGVPDDGVGGGGACSTGQPGPCGQGTLTCGGGGMTCQPTVTAVAEVCGDGVDNDCNGQVDNGCSTCAHDPCQTGVKLDPACDPCVALICFVDSFCCTTQWDLQCVAEVALTCAENC